jgi:hypothetical protein
MLQSRNPRSRFRACSLRSASQVRNSVACLICLPAKRKCHRPSELKPLAEHLNAGPLRTSFANHRQSASAAIGGACSSGTAVGAKGCSAGQRVAGWSCRRGEDDCPLLVVAAGSAGQGEVGWAVADVLERFGCVRWLPSSSVESRGTAEYSATFHTASASTSSTKMPRW